MRHTILLFLFVSLPLFAVTEKACTQQQARLTRSYKYRAAVEADKLLVEVRRAIANPSITWNEWRKLHVAASVISCARRKLGTLNWVCADGVPNNLAARTYPVISNKVYLSDYTFGETRHLYQEALFLHEATHHCGTNDARYFNDGERPDDGSIVGWQSIADTYTYWVQNGFCIPNRDC